MTYAKIDITPDGSLAFRSSYDPDLVDALKREIPYSDRRWDPDRKRWLVTVSHEATLVRISERYLGVTPSGEAAFLSSRSHQPQKETKLFKVEYIGSTKRRDDGSESAFGFCNGDWTIVFPKHVLQSWFELGGTVSSSEEVTSTLYGLLGVRRNASKGDLKKAYRSMAKRYHPDLNKDDDADEMMQKINTAWEVLSDPVMRKRYNAGLHLEESLTQERKKVTRDSARFTWQPPIRCGWILAKGVSRIGRFHVEQIEQWEDVVNERGEIMVTSWPKGADGFVTSWV